MSETVGLLFVCLGNICRSPTAATVFREQAKDLGLLGRFQLDSAGTGACPGEPADLRAIEHAKARGLDLTAARARPVTKSDFRTFDWILAMDPRTARDLRRLDPGDGKARLHMMGEFSSDQMNESGGSAPPVPDPYYGGAEGFETVLDMLEDACANLLRRLKDEHGL